MIIVKHKIVLKYQYKVKYRGKQENTSIVLEKMINYIAVIGVS